MLVDNTLASKPDLCSTVEIIAYGIVKCWTVATTSTPLDENNKHEVAVKVISTGVIHECISTTCMFVQF